MAPNAALTVHLRSLLLCGRPRLAETRAFHEVSPRSPEWSRTSKFSINEGTAAAGSRRTLQPHPRLAIRKPLTKHLPTAASGEPRWSLVTGVAL
jgi:hypothetical protein